MVQGRGVHSVLPLIIAAEAAQRMLPCEISNAAGTCSISGYISAPEDSHGSKAHQLLYLNQRCDSFTAASRLINDLHQQLLASQASGHHQNAGGTAAPAVGSTKSFPAFLIFIRCPEALIASESDDNSGVERDALLRLLRTAVLSSWRADVADSSLQSPAARPKQSAWHASHAADRNQRPGPTRQQPRSRTEMVETMLPSSLQYAGAGRAMHSLVSAPAGDAGRKSAWPGWHRISSDKRMAWHSAPGCSSISGTTTADQPIVDAWQQLHETTSPVGDTAVPQTARVSAADVSALWGSGSAGVARRSLAPSMQQRPSGEQLIAAPQRSAGAMSAAPKHFITQSAGLSAACRGDELLAELLREDDLPQQVLRPARQADAHHTSQQHSAQAYATCAAPTAAAQRGSDAVPARASPKKRGRRGSWPPSPPVKRRAVHRNPEGSLQVATTDLAAGLHGTCSTPGDSSRHSHIAAWHLTQGLPKFTPNMVAPGATDGAGNASVSRALGWRQRKPIRIEGAARVATSAARMNGTPPTVVAGKEELHELSSFIISRSRGCEEPAAAPSKAGAPHPVAKQVEDSASDLDKARPLDALLSRWRNPCIGPTAARCGVLQLGDLAPGLTYLTVPQAVDRASFKRARVLQQVRQAHRVQLLPSSLQLIILRGSPMTHCSAILMPWLSSPSASCASEFAYPRPRSTAAGGPEVCIVELRRTAGGCGSTCCG